MSINEKVIVFPYNLEFSPIIRHKDLLKNLTIVGLVSPIGWGFNGKDACTADGGSEINKIVSCDFEGLLNKCDTVIICNSRDPLDFKCEIYPNIIKAISCRKNIICLISLEDENKAEIKRLCNENNVYFKYLYSNRKKSYNTGGIEKLFKIETPIVFVIGTTIRTSKFEIQLNIKEGLLNIGYKISQIGSRDYCDLLGFHSFPGFMYDNNLNEAQKIVLFNNYVKRIEYDEKPDLIIIGIPGGIMKINDTFTNNFGIFAYEVSQAVSPDYVICSTLYEEYTNEYFIRLANSVKYKLGFEVDCFNFANVKLDWVKSNEQNSEVYVSLDSRFINKEKKRYRGLDIPLYNIFSMNDSQVIISDIVKKLSEYSEIGAI